MTIEDVSRHKRCVAEGQSESVCACERETHTHSHSLTQRRGRPSGRALFDFLDICLLARDENGNQALTDEEIRSQCDTFLFAGHDTTSTALSFITYHLSRNPECQEKV